MPAEVTWGKNQKANFRDWIYHELFDTLGARGELERKWRDLIVAWRARVVGNGTSDVPFIGAADLEYPLTAIQQEPVYADLMQTLHIPRDFWSVVPLRSEMVDVAKPFQEFLSGVERNYIRMRNINKKAFLDLTILGTTVYKDQIHHATRRVVGYNEAGDTETSTKVTFAPSVRHIPLQDFFIPAYAWNVDPDVVGGAPWVAERFTLNASQLRIRAEAQAPFLPNYDKAATETVLSYISDKRDDAIKELHRREDEFVPVKDNVATLYEIWARYDANGDGVDEDVVVTWHQDTSTILRSIYMPFDHGARPFSSACYLPGFGFYGVGLAEANEWAQLAMSRVLNATLNNAFISSTKMFGVPMGANISPDEPIYPGKVWPLGTGERIEAINLGDINPSMFQLFDRFLQWSESRTAVSEIRQGNMSNLPGRTPASTVMSILSEGSKRFDMVLANLRSDALADIGQRTVQNLVQISRTDPRWIAFAMTTLGQQDGMAVAQVLRSPASEIEDLFGINVTATSSQVNKEVEKQSLTGLAQLMTQLYPQLIQYSQAIAQFSKDPTLLVSTVQAAYTGQTELAKRLLESFDVQNPEQYLPAVAAQARGAPGAPAAPTAPGGLQAAPLGGPGGPGPFAQGAGQIGQLLGLG